MNKTELIDTVAQKAEISKADAQRALDAITDTIQTQLTKGDSVQILGFGSFATSERSGRTGRNPQTGETIEIPARRTPQFKAGKALKEAVNA